MKQSGEELEDSSSIESEENEGCSIIDQPGPSHAFDISNVTQPSPVQEFETLNASLSDISISEKEGSLSSSCSIISSNLDDQDIVSDCSSESGPHSSKDRDTLLPLKDFLRSWSKENNITLSALSSLSVGLKTHHPECFSNLPSDGRTILKTPVKVIIDEMPPGQYLHIGLKRQLGLIFFSGRRCT